MRYRYFGTMELWSVPLFTRQGDMSCVECLWVCPVLAMQAYVDRTSFELYIHSDLVYPFPFPSLFLMSQVSTGLMASMANGLSLLCSSANNLPIGFVL